MELARNQFCRQKHADAILKYTEQNRSRLGWPFKIIVRRDFPPDELSVSWNGENAL